MVAAASIFGTAPLIPQIVRMFFCSHTRKTKPELVNEWKEKFLSVPFQSVLHTAAALISRDSVVNRLGEIEVPALIVVGEMDEPLPPAYSREIVGALVNASLVEVKKAGHMSNLEQPELFNAALLAFLRQFESSKVLGSPK